MSQQKYVASVENCIIIIIVIFNQKKQNKIWIRMSEIDLTWLVGRWVGVWVAKSDNLAISVQINLTWNGTGNELGNILESFIYRVKDDSDYNITILII